MVLNYNRDPSANGRISILMQFRRKAYGQLFYDVCYIDIAEYVNGRTRFSCKSTIDRELTSLEKTKINLMMAEKTEMKDFSPLRVRKLREKFEKLFISSKKEFYDWKDNLDTQMSELGINETLLQVMYPRYQDILALSEK